MVVGTTYEQIRIKVFSSVNVDGGKIYLCIIGGDLVRTCPLTYQILKDELPATEWIVNKNCELASATSEIF